MIDIKNFIKNKNTYKDYLERKNFNDKYTLDKLKEIYEINLSLLKEEEELRQKLNKITSDIKKDKGNSNLISEASEVSKKIKETSLLKAKTSFRLNDLLLTIPNTPLPSVPIGKGEEDNKVLNEYNQHLKNKSSLKLEHWKILENKNLILKQEAAKMSGRRHVIFQNKAAILIRALETFMLERHFLNGYQVIDPPVIVNEEALINTGQLPNFKNDLFKLESLNQYLIPTAEVPLTNLVANKILKEKNLPLSYTGFTNCFRNENVAAGHDARGIVRLYQFRKVEIVKIGKEKDYEKDFNAILEDAKNILEMLELPYRTVELCTGDLSFSSKRTIDLEVYMAGSDEYREVSSVSYMGDFQTRRMKTRFLKEDGTKEIPVSYNGSALAIERVFAALLENNLDSNGNIIIPKVLWKYLPFKVI